MNHTFFSKYDTRGIVLSELSSHHLFKTSRRFGGNAERYMYNYIRRLLVYKNDTCIPVLSLLQLMDFFIVLYRGLLCDSHSPDRLGQFPLTPRYISVQTAFSIFLPLISCVLHHESITTDTP